MASSSQPIPPPISTNPASASPSGPSPTSPVFAGRNSETASKITSTGDSASNVGEPALGTLLRLRPLTIHDLPVPPGWVQGNTERGPPPESAYWLGGNSVEHVPLVEFIEKILLEGHRFIKTDKKFKSLGKTTSKPSTAKVEKTHRVVTESELRDVDWESSICTNRRGFKPKKEDWYGRRSTHITKLADGTATWNEFIDGLLFNHSENEAEYDPSVYDHRCIIDWKPQIEEKAAQFDPRFSEINMKVMEMCHTIPLGTPRHFTTLVVSGKLHPVCFVTVQVPVDISKDVPEAFYSIGRNQRECEGQKAKRTIEGMYTSIEQCKHFPEKGEVEWRMTTASDAGGMIPLVAQKLALPSQVAKDVGFFMKWAIHKFPRPTGSRSRQASRASNGSKRGPSPKSDFFGRPTQSDGHGSFRRGQLSGGE